MSLPSWPRPLSTTTMVHFYVDVDVQLYVVSKILDARFNEQVMFHELLAAWRGFPVGEATWELYSVMAVDVPDMVAKFTESHEDIDTVRMMRSL
jgi:hypothetical protein